MSVCKNCDTTYSALSRDCPWCDRRREELLERLRVDREAATIAEVAGWAAQGVEEKPGRRWEVL